jgi:hypothetical protein
MANLGHGKLMAAIHFTPGHRKDLRALTNGKCDNGELWVADTSHTWTKKGLRALKNGKCGSGEL